MGNSLKNVFTTVDFNTGILTLRFEIHISVSNPVTLVMVCTFRNIYVNEVKSWVHCTLVREKDMREHCINEFLVQIACT